MTSVTAIALYCALSLTPSACTPDTATHVVRPAMEPGMTVAVCGKVAMEILALTALDHDKDGMYIKVICREERK